MFRRTCGELLVRFFIFCVRGYGRGGRPAFPAPSSFLEGCRSTARAHSRRGNALVCFNVIASEAKAVSVLICVMAGLDPAIHVFVS
jgi:hypothetical protein